MGQRSVVLDADHPHAISTNSADPLPDCLTDGRSKHVADTQFPGLSTIRGARIKGKGRYMCLNVYVPLVDCPPLSFVFEVDIQLYELANQCQYQNQYSQNCW